MDSAPLEPDMTHASEREDPLGALLAATIRLSDNVETLSSNLSVQSQQSRRLRRIGLAVLAVLVLVAGVGYYAVNENHDTQVTNCENANETRQAARVLWNYVLDLASVNSPNPDNLAKIKDWVNELYAERDCTDLSREYDQPPPPDLKGGKKAA